VWLFRRIGRRGFPAASVASVWLFRRVSGGAAQNSAKQRKNAKK
jgi:hypothetical protein